jgi:hypothetical protein
MATLEEIANQLDALSAENLDEVAKFVGYLKWKQGPSAAAGQGLPWGFDFVERFREASFSADQDPAGMDVQVGEAACDNEWQMALWQHPPVTGSAIIEYQVPVPEDVGNLRLVFSTGIRDGSQLAPGNVVAFRVFVNDWKVWSETQHVRRWKRHEISLPTLPGDVTRIHFVTDGLGNHEWAWAVWGEPRLLGEIEHN